MHVNLNKFDFERFGVEKHNLASLMEFGYCKNAHLLSRWPLDSGCIESGLIANEVDVRTFFDDELILLLKRIAPYGIMSESCSSGTL